MSVSSMIVSAQIFCSNGFMYGSGSHKIFVKVVVNCCFVISYVFGEDAEDSVAKFTSLVKTSPEGLLKDVSPVNDAF